MFSFAYSCHILPSVIVLALSGVVTLINVFVTMHLILRLCQTRRDSKIKLYIIIPTIVSSFLWSVSAVGNMVSTMIEQSCSFKPSDYQDNTFVIITFATFGFAGYMSFVALYTVFSIRLIYIVKNSAFEFSSTFEKLLYILGGLQICCYLAAVYSFVNLTSNSTNIGWILLGFAIAIYILSCIFLCFKFINKLKYIAKLYALQVTKMQPSSVLSTTATDSDIHDQIADEKKKLIRVMAKNTILLCFALLTSLIVAIIFILQSVNNKQHYYIKQSIAQITFGIDTTNNLICIYLQFPFATKHYNLLCNHCRYWTERRLYASVS